MYILRGHQIPIQCSFLMGYDLYLKLYPGDITICSELILQFSAARCCAAAAAVDDVAAEFVAVLEALLALDVVAFVVLVGAAPEVGCIFLLVQFSSAYHGP